MDLATQAGIDQQLRGLKGSELATVASHALANCNDLACQNDVLTRALNQAGTMIPTHVGEGTRLGLTVGSGGLVGMLRGTFGPLWGRIASAVPGVAGLAIGLASKDPSGKAAGYSILGGTGAGGAAIETYDLGMILRSKMLTDVGPRPTGTPNPAPAK